MPPRPPGAAGANLANLWPAETPMLPIPVTLGQCRRLAYRRAETPSEGQHDYERLPGGGPPASDPVMASTE